MDLPTAVHPVGPSLVMSVVPQDGGSGGSDCIVWPPGAGGVGADFAALPSCGGGVGSDCFVLPSGHGSHGSYGVALAPDRRFCCW